MKVAIVEDDGVLAMLLEEVCRTSGYRVVGIASGAGTAISMIERWLPDCLLLDFNLDGERNGLDLLGEAKRTVPSLFSVMITAWDINDIASRIDTVQPDRILRKPVHTETLVGILDAHRRALGGIEVRNTEPPLSWQYRRYRPLASR